MSTQDLIDRNAVLPDQVAPPTAGALASEDLRKILTHITELIADTDRRQGDALREMQDRLKTLGNEAQLVRNRVPAEYAPAFERIESGLELLRERLGKTDLERAITRAVTGGRDPAPNAHPLAEPQAVAPSAAQHRPIESTQQSPAPLRSAVSEQPARPQLATTIVDPFDIVDSSRPGDADSPWDDEAAELLTKTYELSDPGLVTATPPATISPAAPMPVAAREPAIEARLIEIPAAPVAGPASLDKVFQAFASPAATAPVQPVDFGRAWLETKFAEIATKVEQSLSEMKPDDSLHALGSRITQLETRVGIALEDVARSSDIEKLQQVGAHIDELADSIEQSQLQLQRLDTIEAQLNAVMEKLSDQRLSELLGNSPHPAPEHTAQDRAAAIDVNGIAAAAAEQVAARLAEMQPRAGAGDAERMQELRNLLQSFMLSHRQGEESIPPACWRPCNRR